MTESDSQLHFRPVKAESIEILEPYFCLRPNKTCESVFLDGFLWRNYSELRYAVSSRGAIQWLMSLDGREVGAMPACRQEDLKDCFYEMVRFFNESLRRPYEIRLADEEAVTALNLDPEKYEVREVEDLKDYLYDGEAMRTLAGKKLHKKKNNLNAFLREYGDRAEYRRLCCSDRCDVWDFLDRWRQDKGEDVEEHLDYEIEGIHEILNNCSILGVRMSGVYVDGNLEAFTIGSYNPCEQMAIIHIEKANSGMRGLYQFINQQFLIHEFPDAVLVNREDDLGLEGLRRAKMSYCPVGFARKYSVKQREMGII